MVFQDVNKMEGSKKEIKERKEGKKKGQIKERDRGLDNFAKLLCYIPLILHLHFIPTLFCGSLTLCYSVGQHMQILLQNKTNC